MKKFIITSTINSATETIRKFDENPEWELIVIGDKKTPSDYNLKNKFKPRNSYEISN